MILRFLTRLVVPAAAVFAVSCTGYHIGASKPARLANVHTIAVPNFKNMTLADECLGTPTYCAPEQLRGENPSVQADLYAWAPLPRN